MRLLLASLLLLAAAGTHAAPLTFEFDLSLFDEDGSPIAVEDIDYVTVYWTHEDGRIIQPDESHQSFNVYDLVDQRTSVTFEAGCGPVAVALTATDVAGDSSGLSGTAQFTHVTCHATPRPGDATLIADFEFDPIDEPPPPPPGGEPELTYPELGGWNPLVSGPARQCGSGELLVDVRSPSPTVSYAHFGTVGWSVSVEGAVYCWDEGTFDRFASWNGQSLPDVTYLSNDSLVYSRDTVEGVFRVGGQRVRVYFIDGATFSSFECMPGAIDVGIYQDGSLVGYCD